jgi:hypothetical protein
MDYHELFKAINDKKLLAKKEVIKKVYVQKIYHYCQVCNKEKHIEKDMMFALCFKCNYNKKMLILNGC